MYIYWSTMSDGCLTNSQKKHKNKELYKDNS